MAETEEARADGVENPEQKRRGEIGAVDVTL